MQDGQATMFVPEGLATRLAPGGPGVLAVHGTDPVTGLPTTWHLRPRRGADGAPAGYRVDLADVAGRPSGEVPTQRS